MNTTFDVNYDLKGSFLQPQSDSTGFVSLTLRQTQRCIHRSLSGYETLLRERPLSRPSQLQFEIPTQFLASAESCCGYLDRLLSEENLDRRILHRLVSEIPAAATEMGTREGGGAFLIEVEVDVIEQSLMEETKGWNKMAVPVGRDGSAVAGYGGGRAEEMSCAVCLEELSGGTGCMEMPCSHVFHRDCVFRWLRQNQSCPMCRGKVS